MCSICKGFPVYHDRLHVDPSTLPIHRESFNHQSTFLCLECLYHEALNKEKVWTDALELERLAYYSFFYSEEEYEHLRILRFARKHDMQIQVREDDGNDHQEYTAEQIASAQRKEEMKQMKKEKKRAKKNHSRK